VNPRLQSRRRPADNAGMRQATFNLIIAAVISVAAVAVLTLYV
jgi:hypothetical protein